MPFREKSVISRENPLRQNLISRENEKNLKTRDVLNRYLATINNVVALSQYKKGSGVRKTQTTEKKRI